MTGPELLAALRSDVILGAQKLLGAELVRGTMRARIVETEAYRAEDDPGSHAYRGRTKRNAIMFEEPGFAYVYFNYGVHWMLNVTSHEPGRAAAVLIRAAEPLEGLDQMALNRGVADPRNLLSGPGKLAKAFGITGADNGINLFDPSSSLYLEPPRSEVAVVSTVRIGLADGKGHELPWRFLDADGLRWVSRRPRSGV